MTSETQRHASALPPTGEVGKLVAWANQASRYFELLPTNGEDSAHWANVSNAETASRVADALERLSACLAEAELDLANAEELQRDAGRELEQYSNEIAAQRARAERAERERDEALAKLNAPELYDFSAGVILEAAHQRDRWGAQHDAGKQPQDWFWLIGYLAGKALAAHIAGNDEKALHHTISTAAACANWHAAISGANTTMRPGIDAVARGIEVGGSHV